MAIQTLSPRASISLQLMAQTQTRPRGVADISRAMTMSTRSLATGPTTETLVPVILEINPGEDVAEMLEQVKARDVEELTKTFLSATVPLSRIQAAYSHRSVRFVESVKEKKTLMEVALVAGTVGLPSKRRVSETGKGVIVGVVDSGFDLSHPMFRDAQGKLRVDALLDQTTNQEFTAAQLKAGWAPGGTRPGADDQGHGTHVASIAAGSNFASASGIAPDATFVLVRTDFQRIANGVKWCFDKARQRPCVVNLSLGGHFGPHDGTSAEERVMAALSGKGRIICIAAGNERDENIHIGARFSPGQTETAAFDVAQNVSPQMAMTLWYDHGDTFDFTLVSPAGQQIALPPIGSSNQQQAHGASIELGRNVSAGSATVQVQIFMEFASGANSFDDLRGWKLTIKCVSAAVGRIDGWMAGERLAQFRDGPLLETARTIGMPATSNNVIAVASHVSKNTWMSDLGIQSAPVAVVDRSSRFSSRGPTRDGRQKPEISAPGEMITAALADKSELANEPTRANSAAKLLTIEGTSMATPFVTGVVVLLLQRNGTLAAVDVIDVFRTSAVKDQHTGPTDWTPEYGHGKISGEQAAKAVAAVVASIAAPTTAHPSRRAGPAKKATTATAKRAKTKVTVPA